MHSGKARLAGVMGWPVGHSLSPLLHGTWFERQGIDGVYVPLAVRPEDFAQAFRALPKLGFLGVNVTLPHKEAAFAAVDQRERSAERAGVVNTVLFGPGGRAVGLSTDGAGFLANLREQAPSWNPASGPALLIGTGGAARAVAVALLEAGVPALRLANRTAAKAESLARALADLGLGPVELIPWDARHAALAGAMLVVNGTSQGMTGEPPLDLRLDALPPAAAVADLVYTPLETPLLARARARGHAVVDGLGMLIHQAVPGFRHWGGVEPPVDAAIRATLLQALAQRG
jgi:shikimate dehydrogenase